MLFYETKVKLALLEELDIHPTYKANIYIMFLNKSFGHYSKDVILWVDIEDSIRQKIQSLIQTNKHWKDIHFYYNKNKNTLELPLNEEFISYLLRKNTKYLLTQNLYKSIESQLYSKGLSEAEKIEVQHFMINPKHGIQLNKSRPYDKDIILHYNLEVTDTDKKNIKFLKIKDEEQVYSLLLIENKFLGTKI